MKSKTTRQRIISSTHNNNPILILKGKWFKACGFIPGDNIEIRIYKGKLVITNKGSKFNK